MLEILLVSDDEPFEQLIRDRLGTVGHRITTCGSMPATFDVLSRIGNSFHLIVIALAHPMGEDAERYARWLGTNARVVVVPTHEPRRGPTVINLMDLVGEDTAAVSLGSRS
ncbi:MAG: hypothetical protein WKG01_40820 [Kofleriaceae bacterium]